MAGSGFQPDALRSKLATLNATQQSIETVSSYCTFFRKEARKVVSVWEAEFGRTTDMQKKMALLYLANDVLQNSRKRGTHFVVDFYRALPAATRHMLKHGDANVHKGVRRVIAIWDERKVFGALGIKPFLEAADNAEATGSGQLANGKAAADDVNVSTSDGIRSLLLSIDTSAAACSSLSQRASPALSQEWVESTDRGSLEGAGRMLGQYTQALQAEVQQRQELGTVLRSLLAAQEKGIQAAQAQLGQCKAQSSLIDARVNQPSSAVQSSTPVSAHGGVVPPAPSGNPPATSPSSPEGLEALVQDMDTYSPTAEAPLPAMGLTPGLQSWGSEGFPYTPSAPPTEYSPFDLPDPDLPTEQYTLLDPQPASTTPSLHPRDPRGASRDPREGRDPRQQLPGAPPVPSEPYAQRQQQQQQQQQDAVQEPYEQPYSPAADGDMDMSTDQADAEAVASSAAHAEPGGGYDAAFVSQPDVPQLAGDVAGAWASMLQLPGLAQQGADAGHFSSGASEASQQASQQAPTSAAADMARQLAAGHMSTEDLLAAISSLPKGSIEGLNL